MARTAVWVGLTLLTLWLSGCAAADAKDPVSPPGASVSATGEALADAGSLRVTVVDDAALPLQGAIVGVTELALQAVTDDTGTALFTNLPPGSYQVAAATLGYSSAGKAVNVEAAAEAGVTLVLVPIVVETSFHQTFGPFQGYFDCRMGTATWTAPCGTVAVPVVGFVGPGTAGVNPWSNDNSILKFQVATNSTQTVIGDMRWSPSAVGTSTSLRFAFSYDGRPSTHWWCAGEGPSELQWRWEAEGESTCANVGSSDEEPVPRTHNDEGQALTMRVYANAPFGTLENPMYLTLQQKFEIVTTVFYVDRAPDLYSGFADA